MYMYIKLKNFRQTDFININKHKANHKNIRKKIKLR